MPRYYCDYCDTYLTHDSPSVRKQHNAGYKHKANVRSYYQQFEEEQTQSLIDQRIKQHLGQTAAFQQVGAAYTHHLASFPQRPRLPILPTPGLPMMGTVPGSINSPLAPGIRPPILPRPVAGVPGYGPPPLMQPMVAPPPGAASIPMQVNGLPGPPTINPPIAAPASMVMPSSNGAPAMYQANSTAPNINASSGLQMLNAGGSAAPPTNTGLQEGFSYDQGTETSQ